MSFIAKLICARRGPFRRLTTELLAIYGVEVPPGVEVGRNLHVKHRGFGTVIHPSTVIGDGVTFYHGVTIGRADVWIPGKESPSGHAVIENDVTLCAGAKVIFSAGILTVGRGTIVGANAVLTKSTGPNEIWAGAPARKVGDRADQHTATEVSEVEPHHPLPKQFDTRDAGTVRDR